MLDRLLASSDACVRAGARLRLQGADAGAARPLRDEIRASPRVRALLSERGGDGRIPGHPYAKWGGAHWVLAALAELGYPPGDAELVPLREQVYGWLLSKSHDRSIRALGGRVRRCASQEGNAAYALLTLGLADPRTDELVERLLRWQWPDGGWNCDKRPQAVNSSFMETLIPLRAVALYARLGGGPRAERAAERAADVFLKRDLYKRRRDGKPISRDFVALHYPCYWHYDVLFGLKVMAEAGFLADPRCGAALELLRAKRLPDGSFPAEAKYYRTGRSPRSGRSLVDWGGASPRRGNEFVTLDALAVLKAAGDASAGSA
jgi:hypothetical protein